MQVVAQGRALDVGQVSCKDQVVLEDPPSERRGRDLCASHPRTLGIEPEGFLDHVGKAGHWVEREQLSGGAVSNHKVEEKARPASHGRVEVPSQLLEWTVRELLSDLIREVFQHRVDQLISGPDVASDEREVDLRRQRDVSKGDCVHASMGEEVCGGVKDRSPYFVWAYGSANRPARAAMARRSFRHSWIVPEASHAPRPRRLRIARGTKASAGGEGNPIESMPTDVEI